MISLADLISALRARWRMELAIALAGLLLVGVWTFLSSKTYVATSSLLFEDKAIEPVVQGNGSDTVAAQVATQADVVHSGAIAAQVSRNLALATDPRVVSHWRATTGGVGDINTWFGQTLLGNLTVTPTRSSRVLAIQFKANDPQLSASVANAFAQSYIDTRLRQVTDPARTYSRWFEARTREVRTALEAAQAKLTAFQRDTGIVDVGPNNADTGRLAQLSQQLTGAEGESADLRARAGGDLAASPSVQNSQVIESLRTQISAKTAVLSQLSSDLGPNHPVRQAAQAELNALRQRLAVETGTTMRTVAIASGAASHKEETMRRTLQAQRRDMLVQASNRAQLDVLQRDVDSARASYDIVTQRLGTIRLQSETPTTNVTQLDVASPPTLPDSPNVPLRLALGLIFSVLLAVGVAAALEVWRPRVRTSAGIAAIAGAPVIGRISFARSRVHSLLTEKAAA